MLEFPLWYQDDNFQSWLKKQTQDRQLIDFVDGAERIEGDFSLHI